MHLSNELTRYKKENNLIDYNDMILDFIRSDKSPKFDVVFIDEAQDLSMMQWNMAKTIWNKTKILLLQVMMTKLYLDGLVRM